MTLTPWLLFTGALVLVGVGGLMAAIESAIGVRSRAELHELADHARFATAIRRIAEEQTAHVNSVSFVRVLAETLAAVLVTLGFVGLVSSGWLVLLYSAIIMTAASFLLVGTSPRSVGRKHADVVLRTTAPLARAIRTVLGPFAHALVAIGNRVTPGRHGRVSSEAHLLTIVDEAAELDVLDEEDRELIHSVFEFNETVVREVMVPRTYMVTLDEDDDLTTAMAEILSAGVSRVPVIGRDTDDVVGLIYLRDLVKFGFERSLDGDGLTVAALARPATFVPDSMKADALLKQMQLDSIHLAMVVDEYGGIAGLVTLEDLIEELVGEISDEYDREQATSTDLGDGHFRVSPRLSVDELGELFGLDLEDDDVDTVGGLLAKELGRLPKVGEQVLASGIWLQAEVVDRRRGRLGSVLAWPDESLQRARAGTRDEDAE
ncbi:MAG TPA: hemolysin family protein [Candidatus Lumbricidophila sp.]|nr:hemolysin family protein [Candidatus Lumbricidophila sp.]